MHDPFRLPYMHGHAVKARPHDAFLFVFANDDGRVCASMSHVCVDVESASPL